jgi:putative ABC transport system permease protein
VYLARGEIREKFRPKAVGCCIGNEQRGEKRSCKALGIKFLQIGMAFRGLDWPSASTNQNSTNMFKNYWTIAVRSLQRNKSYTLINFLGLTVGMAASLLLFLLVRYETSFDAFHTKKDRIYRVVTVNRGDQGESRLSAVTFPLAGALKAAYPQLEQVVPTYLDWDEKLIVQGGDGQAPKVFQDNALYAGSAFFKTFDYGALEGDPRTLLDVPYTAMLTKAKAAKYFGDWRTAVGKTLQVNHRVLVKVAGILQDPPPNTDFPIGVVVSLSTLTDAHMIGSAATDWSSINGGTQCYVLLKPGTSMPALERSIDQTARAHQPDKNSKSGAGLQALGDMHYDTTLDIYSGTTFSRKLIEALVLIGFFLVVIACINFVNLATAQAVNRSREVGVRKVLGSGRRQLVFRFLAETGMISALALVAAVLLAVPLLGPLNDLLEIKLSAAPLSEPVVMAFLPGVWVVVTMLSGVYPSLVLSGFNPINALKSKVAASSTRGISLRRGLVVLQFVIAQVLITGVLVIVSQMNYFRHADLGFTREAIVNVRMPNDSLGQLRQMPLRQEIMRNPGVEEFSYSFASPTDYSGSWSDFRYDHAKTNFGVSLRWADTSYFQLYKLRLVAGRLYNNDVSSDTTREFIVNETCVRKLGLRHPQDAIGHQINFWDGQQVGQIVGVVKDYHVSSLKDSIAPVVMWPSRNLYLTANIKVQPARMKETVTAIEKAWRSAFPTGYFNYQFLDDKLASLYKQEDQLSVLYRVFAGIAIFISCLGLYGLVSFMAVQRNKEIGIRKVLGASVGQVVFLLSKEFTVLVLLAFAIATPLSWYFMHQWLQQYVYRIDLGPGFFIVTVVAAVVIAWLTVGYRAIRAALANPVGSLRSAE